MGIKVGDTVRYLGQDCQVTEVLESGHVEFNHEVQEIVEVKQPSGQVKKEIADATHSVGTHINHLAPIGELTNPTSNKLYAVVANKYGVIDRTEPYTHPGTIVSQTPDKPPATERES